MYIDSSFLVYAQWEKLAQNLIPIIKITTVVLQHVLNFPQSCNKYDARWVINGRSSSQMTWGTNQAQCWSGENRDMTVSPSTSCRFTHIYGIFSLAQYSFTGFSWYFLAWGHLIRSPGIVAVTSVCLSPYFGVYFYQFILTSQQERNGKLSMN